MLKHFRRVSRTPPLNVENSLSVVYWLLRVIPLGLRCEDEIKFLAVTINPILNWEPHLSKLQKHLNKILRLLFVASRF